MKEDKPRTLRSAFSKLKDDAPLERMARETVLEWFDAKHRKAAGSEILLINSLPVDGCPFCGSARIVHDGRRKDGVQTHLCRDCGRRFNPLTGTLFDSHKIPLSEWLEFLVHVVQLQSTICASIDNQNAYNTGRYWLRKLFAALEGFQDDIRLSGEVGVDECFLPEKPGDTVLDGDGRRLRGTSRNQYCIYCATDGRNAVLLPMGKGSPSASGVRETILPHMKEATGFHDDGDSAHKVIERQLGIPRRTFLSKETTGLDDSRNPMDDINSVHREFKRLMRAHGAYDREDIRGYCDLESFLYAHHGDKVSAVMDLLERTIRCKKVMRYRKTLAKKG